MGVDIGTYRCRIGCFTQPTRRRMEPVASLKMTGLCLSIRIFLFFLLCAQGVEQNPGPTGRGQTGGGRGSGRGQVNGPRSNGERQPSYSQVLTSPPNTRSSQRESLANNGANRQQNLNSWMNGASNSQTNTSVNRSSASQAMFEDTQDRFDDCGQTDSTLDNRSLLLEIRGDVKQMNHKFDKLEQSVSDLQKENQILKEQNVRLFASVHTLSETLDEVKYLATENEIKTEKLEAQSRRNNLKFHGVPEAPNETWDQTEAKIRDYMVEIGVDEGSIRIDRAHRLPGKTTPRPIIVKFPMFKDRDSILTKFRDRRKNGEESFGDYADTRVVEDFPERITKQRSLLYPLLKRSIDNHKKAFYRYDKLVVDGTVFTYDYNIGEPVQVGK